MSETAIELIDPDDDQPDDERATRKIGLGFWLAIGWLVLISATALLAPWLPVDDPTEFKVRPGELPPYPPSGDFWFGSDKNARDVFARTIHGARVSLFVGFFAIGSGMLIGGLLGLTAGYFRGWWDRIVSFVFVVQLSFPALVLAILITSLVDRRLITIASILGFLSIAPVGRLARASTIQFAEREFVLAARTLGASHTRIILRELLPNVVIPMAALGLLAVAVSIVAEGSLAFLGLSVDSISWGNVIVEGSGTTELRDAPWMALTPMALLFLTVAALNFAGDRLRRYFDVKEISL